MCEGKTNIFWGITECFLRFCYGHLLLNPLHGISPFGYSNSVKNNIEENVEACLGY